MLIVTGRKIFRNVGAVTAKVLSLKDCNILPQKSLVDCHLLENHW